MFLDTNFQSSSHSDKRGSQALQPSGSCPGTPRYGLQPEASSHRPPASQSIPLTPLAPEAASPPRGGDGRLGGGPAAAGCGQSEARSGHGAAGMLPPLLPLLLPLMMMMMPGAAGSRCPHRCACSQAALRCPPPPPGARPAPARA